MASVNGIQIKNLKAIKNPYGDDYYTGTVYLNGTKLGFWCQDPMGESGDSFDFRQSSLDKPFYSWKSYMKDVKNYEYLDLDALMMDVIYYTMTERFYKTQVRLGFKYLFDIHVMGTLDGMSQAQPKNAIPRDKEMQFKVNVQNNYKTMGISVEQLKFESKIYTSVDDFKIVFGTVEGMKEEQEKVERRLKGIAKDSNRQTVEEYSKIILNYHLDKRFKVLEVSGANVKVQELQNRNVARIPAFQFEDHIRVLSEFYPSKLVDSWK